MKKMFSLAMVLSILTMSLAGCGGNANFASAGIYEDVPCAYCENTPSKGYSTSSGEKFYVCKDCSSTCMICGEKKATHHYENALSMVMFACDDCYESLKSLNED